MALDRPLLLSGPMGAGKSTIGRIVATRLGLPFEDTDALVEKRAGRSIRQLFADDGETAFRALERDVVEAALADPTPRVIALGGGALVEASVRRRALTSAAIVVLQAPVATLVARAGADRPLLARSNPEDVLRQLLRERGPAYAEAHATIDTTSLEVETVASSVIEAWETAGVVVPLLERSYAVSMASADLGEVARLARSLEPTSVVLITDVNVEPLWAPTLRSALSRAGLSLAATIVLDGTEASKSFGRLEAAVEQALAAGLDRGGLVLALGGGVVTDFSGFLASIYMRGVRWIAIPTTILGLVDASVGGKTAVDVGRAKNVVGAFHQPAGVFAAVELVATEPERSYRSGFAEVVKSLALGDPLMFDALGQLAPALLERDRSALGRVVRASLQVKATIVGMDERETGPRAWLNFGHTLGHALESVGEFTRWTHGEAVAMGISAILDVGRVLGATSAETVSCVTQALELFGLPTRAPADALSMSLDRIRSDKKRLGTAVRVVLLEAVGRPRIEIIEETALRNLFVRVGTP